MTTEPTTRSDSPAPWLHRLAWLNLALTLVQLGLGSVVTTYRVGMADPIWPTTPWALALISWEEPSPGFLIEHVHRLVGHLVGYSVLGLAAWLWLREPRRWLRLLGLLAVVTMTVTLGMGFGIKQPWTWGLCLGTCAVAVAGALAAAWRLGQRPVWMAALGTVALAGVIVQGLLGGFRVQLNALAGTDLAILHGSLAQVYFAFLAGLVFLTRPKGWPTGFGSKRLHLMAVLVLILLVGQLVLGALVRHSDLGSMQRLWQRLHLIGAFAVTAAVVGLVLQVRSEQGRVGGWAGLLAGLVSLQLLLGIEAWMVKFSSGVAPGLSPVIRVSEVVVRTGHVLTGACVLATAAVLMLAVRGVTPAAPQAELPKARLEGAA